MAKSAAIRAITAPKEKAHLTPMAFQINPMRRLAGKAPIPTKKW
jgi:hypothetical protein